MLLVSASFNFVPPGSYLPFMGFRLPKSERKLAGNAEDLELLPNYDQALRSMQS